MKITKNFPNSIFFCSLYEEPVFMKSQAGTQKMVVNPVKSLTVIFKSENASFSQNESGFMKKVKKS